MSTTILKTVEKPRLSVKVQTLATIAAIVGAVAVPQIFHALGAISGLGTALGETFLPMHLPIILVGLLAGPYAGAIAGLLGPAASFALSILLSVYAFGNESIRVATIWMSIGTGIFGLVLQWTLLPLITYRVENLKRHEE